MWKLYLVAALLALIEASMAQVDSKCLGCICSVESGCRPLGCSWDVYSDSCGYYQLKKEYWADCGSPGGSLSACAANKACADQCVQSYMSRYASRCTGGRAPTCQDYARIHNGGPNGCNVAATAGYWNKVSACYNSG